MLDLSALKTVAETYTDMLNETAEAPQQLKHIHHAEDRPLLHGADGFEHAHAALMHAHEHMKSGKHNTHLTMKYDGSPSIVFGHHPKTKKFFVATKSAFNKNPKINYTDKDIDANHGHAPGLVRTLKHALKHLPKVAPKHGVYQGDVLHHADNKQLHENAILLEAKSVSFTPNTITYTAHGDEAKKIARSKFGVVVHQQYHPHGKEGGVEHMSVSPHPDTHNFKQHPDVHLKTAEHDTSKINYPKHDQDAFHKHMAAAKEIHDTHKGKMYAATEKHRGEAGHLSTYINHTVRTNEKPSVQGLQHHITAHYEREAGKLKTPANQQARRDIGAGHVAHIEKHAKHYANLLSMHHHLQQAKNVLVHNLEKHEGGLDHHIGGNKSKPEGFVINHTHKGHEEPTKLVNRAEFARANLLKSRG